MAYCTTGEVGFHSWRWRGISSKEFVPGGKRLWSPSNGEVIYPLYVDIDTATILDPLPKRRLLWTVVLLHSVETTAVGSPEDAEHCQGVPEGVYLEPQNVTRNPKLVWGRYEVSIHDGLLQYGSGIDCPPTVSLSTLSAKKAACGCIADGSPEATYSVLLSVHLGRRPRLVDCHPCRFICSRAGNSHICRP